MERKSFNEVLKQREERKKLERMQNGADDHIALDDAQRVKVLSPGRLVFKRFIRNRLAIVGTCILIFMFLFSFAGALLYPYDQTERFYKYDRQIKVYANAKYRADYTTYGELPKEIEQNVNSAIRDINAGADFDVVFPKEAAGADATERATYVVRLGRENIYTVAPATGTAIAEFSPAALIGKVLTVSDDIEYAEGRESLGNGFYDAAMAALTERNETFVFEDVSYELRDMTKIEGTIYRMGDGEFTYMKGTQSKTFEKSVMSAVEEKQNTFIVDGVSYFAEKSDKIYTIYSLKEDEPVAFSTIYVCDMLKEDLTFSEDERIEFFRAACANEEAVTLGTTQYVLSEVDGVLTISLADGTAVAVLTNFVVRSNGNDNFDTAFKNTVEAVVADMQANSEREQTFIYNLPKREVMIDEKTDPATGEVTSSERVVFKKDENGNQVFEEAEIYITQEVDDYVLRTPTLILLYDINGEPTPIKEMFGDNDGKAKHLFGTDSDGYDVLARMMYGGRISLLVGFVVVILEIILGTVMGGISGYFGGWVDNIIMRLVDVFYCIPSMPILIIIASYMDFLKVKPYVRLMWLMAILGILGWAGVARLVRGQILSLREQEFMVATEATGVRVKRRIFRHLVPNVMPQLIVTATAGLGGVILTEATLSFLGLGVKHPLATWGTMINSITQRNEDILKYTYIWIPVGLLICLTVVAFNFVGDGLRDAFDPKMKK